MDSVCAVPDDIEDKLLSNEDIYPVVTHRYPSVDHEDVPLTEGVAWVRLRIAVGVQHALLRMPHPVLRAQRIFLRSSVYLMA